MEKLIKSQNGQWQLIKAAKEDKSSDDIAKNEPESPIPKKPTEGKGVRIKGEGYRMSGAAGEKMQQLREEGAVGDKRTPAQELKDHLVEARKVSKIPASKGKTVKEREMLAELKDKGRRIAEAADRSKYFTKPAEEKKPKTIRRSKEDMAKALDDMIFNLRKAVDEDHDSEMMFSQLEAIMHHVEEIREAMSADEDSPDWVKAKITEASKQLSDVAHYIQGKKA